MKPALLLAAVAVLAIAGFAIGQTASDKPATLCAKKKGGALRLARDRKCKRTETRLRVNRVVTVTGPTGLPGADGAPGRDATPADFAGEPTTPVAAAPGTGSQCSATAQFCTGGNGWFWQNYGNGYQPVGFWKGRDGVVHLEGVGEQTGGAGGANPAAMFILPDGYRPTAIRRFSANQFFAANPALVGHVEVRPDGKVVPLPQGGSFVPLDGIDFRP